MRARKRRLLRMWPELGFFCRLATADGFVHSLGNGCELETDIDRKVELETAVSFAGVDLFAASACGGLLCGSDHIYAACCIL